MKFELSASSALWPPISRSKLAPSAGPNPLRIGETGVYVRKASVLLCWDHLQLVETPSLSAIGPNQSKTLLASFLLPHGRLRNIFCSSAISASGAVTLANGWRQSRGSAGESFSPSRTDKGIRRRDASHRWLRGSVSAPPCCLSFISKPEARARGARSAIEIGLRRIRRSGSAAPPAIAVLRQSLHVGPRHLVESSSDWPSPGTKASI